MIRARDLGIPFGGVPGAFNAITDVAGVTVGHTTLISGEGPLVVGQGPVRTGVTVILPRGKTYDPVYAATYSLNGNGEMTGTIWIEESGFLESPIGITNTHSVGVVRDAMIEWQIKHKLYNEVAPNVFWSLPVVAETYDGRLNDINGFHVKKEHVFAALDSAVSGVVAEGCVGGGTGMNCYEFKGGIGSSSRVTTVAETSYMVGVLVQANFGSRHQLTIAGIPMGQEFKDIPSSYEGGVTLGESGSIIVIVATDAPLLPHQLKRLARRVPMGMARTGATGGNGSGDIFLAFSTANAGAAQRSGVQTLETLANDAMDGLFEATVQATEEAILNAMITATTMTGINGHTSYAIPHDRIKDSLAKHSRLQK
jgi:L-aminopeptidase/D-esterase-like protein